MKVKIRIKGLWILAALPKWTYVGEPQYISGTVKVDIRRRTPGYKRHRQYPRCIEVEELKILILIFRIFLKSIIFVELKICHLMYTLGTL